MTSPEELTERLDRVRPRLQRLAATPHPGALTDPDPRTGERWDWGQVWAHIAEFPGYWMRQVRGALATMGQEPVSFGRVASDPARIKAIENDRATPPGELWARVSKDLGELRGLIAELTEEEWSRRGLHSTLGVMDMTRIVREFLVGHLESHADQLEALLEPHG